MNIKAKQKLNDAYRVNASMKRYPTTTAEPLSNTLKLHLEIYELIDEYNALFSDMEKASSATKRIIEPRLEEIEKRLLDFWIVMDSDMRVD